MVLENIIRDKIVELENKAEELIQELDNSEEANYYLYGIDVLNDILETYNNAN